MEFKKFMEALKGNQHKIDKNKNGKIDAHDFKLLRKEEDELDEAQYGANLGSRPVSGQKEYQGKEIKSFHPNKEKEAREFAAKNGYVVKKKMLPAGNNITHTWDIHKEETELDEADRIARADYKVAPSGRKSHKEIVFNDGEDDGKEYQREAVEVSHDRYMRSHGKPASGRGQWMFTHKDKGDVDYNNDSEVHRATGSYSDAKKSAQLWAKKHGHSKAYVMEVLDPSMGAGEYVKDFQKSDAPQFKGKSKDKKREMAIAAYMQAKENMKKEETEMSIEEQAPVAPGLVKHRIGVTVSEPDHPMVSKRKEKIQKFVVVTHSDNKEGARKVGEKFYAKKGYRVHDSYHAGIKEEVELEEAAKGHTIEAHGIKGMKGTPWRKTFKSHEHLNDWAEKNDSVEVHGTRDLEKSNYQKEEAEQLDELSPSTLMSYKKKAQQSRDDAKVDAHYQGHRSPNNTGNPVKAQAHADRKALTDFAKKRQAGVKAAAKRLAQEEADLDEAFINGREYASHGLMHPDHAKWQSHRVGVHTDFYAHGTGDKINGQVMKNDGKEVHIKATKSSGGKLHKFKVQSELPKQNNEQVQFDEEGNLMNQPLSFTEFLELNEMEFVNGRYVHKGTYGSAHQGDDDEDDDAPKKPAEPAVKRGRGRPAGAKSGANHKVTSGKKRTGVDYTGYPLHLPNR